MELLFLYLYHTCITNLHPDTLHSFCGKLFTSVLFLVFIVSIVITDSFLVFLHPQNPKPLLLCFVGRRYFFDTSLYLDGTT